MPPWMIADATQQWRARHLKEAYDHSRKACVAWLLFWCPWWPAG